ncbi:ATP-binding protein [Spirillospora sp. CA-294931]|uniref:ATP-binding protein n=1 Tax=Spirillospora sp. CA-294931 TaxID=3240042 RepID=UPI003D8B1D3D
MPPPPRTPTEQPDTLSDRLRLPALPSAVALARRFTAGRLDGWGVPEVIDDVTLVVSELITNAVSHAQAGTGHLVLHLRLTHTRLLCEIWDASRLPPRPTGAEPPDELTENGRGLLLVADCSTDWGYYPSSHGGKCVWAYWDLTAQDAHFDDHPDEGRPS